MKPRPTPRYFTDRDDLVEMGNQLGSPGGEGTAYEVVGDRRLVAKIYHRPEPGTEAKLRAMIALREPRLSTVCAWPEATLHARPGGAMVGFLMPRAAGEPLDDLDAPGSRLSAFPDATYRFVVEVAADLAAAFAVVHAAGAVVCDVKERNAVATQRGRVTLLDCDGFQISDGSGRIFPSRLGTFTHQPPDLRGVRDLSRSVRTPDHDHFGLAVLIFQLLFGRHPYMGMPTTRAELTVEESIRRYQFCYAPQLPRRLLTPPPNAMPLAAVGHLGDLFVRAFLARSPQDHRPTATEWEAALRGYLTSLRTCSANSAHAYVGGSTCPLCTVEARTGVLLFGGGVITPAPGLDLDELWQRILAIPGPGLAPPFPVVGLAAVTPSPAAVSLGVVRRRWKLLGLVALGTATLIGFVDAVATASAMPMTVMLLGIVGKLTIERGGPDARQIDEAWRAGKARLSGLSRRWEGEAGDRSFREKLADLDGARKALQGLEREHARRLERLRRSGRLGQIERHLRTHRLARARIAGIGPSQVALLRSIGVETAADVTAKKLTSVRGLRPGGVRALFLWRAGSGARLPLGPQRSNRPARRSRPRAGDILRAASSRRSAPAGAG